ncbi:MAG TPA: AcvB/VirJ family lysyl-phosphatidylglycerol hydrolase, partial [Thermoanaerobaculia bacterium]|nr:AcvB/VirJ family lysyl-phosphatidylglycerol hydrolase [Thermoanaerobaculia bacterium]
VESRWVPQFRESFRRLTRQDAAAAAAPATPAGPASPVRDLPLVEVPARKPGGNTLAVVLSGDGGWAGLDKEIAGELAGRGVAVVGLNSLQYFWKARTPEESGHDLERVLRHYLPAWHRDKILLIGYSLGADVLPFLARRLPPDLLERTRLIALLGPDRTADFEFHLSEWLGGGEETGRPVLPELRELAGRPILCVYGKGESDSLCPEVNPPLGKSIGLEGAHHFGGDYQAVADLLLREAQLGASR